MLRPLTLVPADVLDLSSLPWPTLARRTSQPSGAVGRRATICNAQIWIWGVVEKNWIIECGVWWETGDVPQRHQRPGRRAHWQTARIMSEILNEVRALLLPADDAQAVLEVLVTDEEKPSNPGSSDQPRLLAVISHIRSRSSQAGQHEEGR